MGLNRNINDDSTLAFLFNKTRQGASDALQKAIEAINATIATIQTALNNKASKNGSDITNAATWRSNINAVNKAGDTMTDILIIQKDTSIAQNYPSQIKLQPHQTDNNLTYTGAYVAVYDDHDAANNGANMVIQSGSNMIIGSGEAPSNLYTAAYKDSAGENMVICGDGAIDFFTNCQTIGNRVNTKIDTSGNFTGKAANVTGTVAIANGGTGATTAANARTNLGAVNKAGDTMTGTLTLNSAGVVEKNTAYAIGDAPGAQTAVSMLWTDKNNSQIGFLGAGWEADGKLFMQIGTNRTVSGTTKWHHVRQTIASDGTASVSFGQPAAWRAGLSLGGMATVASPAPVANGGSGQTGTTSTTTISQIITAASGVTIKSAQYSQWGKVACVYINLTRNAATTTALTSLGTIVSGKRPKIQASLGLMYPVAASTVEIDPNGTLYIRASIAANTDIYVGGTYILA